MAGIVNIFIHLLDIFNPWRKQDSIKDSKSWRLRKLSMVDLQQVRISLFDCLTVILTVIMSFSFFVYCVYFSLVTLFVCSFVCLSVCFIGLLYISVFIILFRLSLYLFVVFGLSVCFYLYLYLYPFDTVSLPVDK